MYVAYHDTEWGVPVRADQRLFEMLCLEGAQAGLSWITVLRKRDTYRQAFDNFDAEKIARYNALHRRRLLQNPGIIRNRLKVDALISNARAYLEVRSSSGSFSDYLWQFTNGKVLRRRPVYLGGIPASTAHRDEQGSEAKGIQICRIDHLLRLHAGGGNRE